MAAEALLVLGYGSCDVPYQRALGTTSLAPGTRLAGYRIEDVVGRGGMGLVYRAVDTALDRTVALKVIAPELTTDPVAVARFKSEAKLAASLDHPSIVTVYGAGEYEGVLYLAMRFIPGTTLQHVVGSDGALELPRARRIVDHVASALDAAHASGLVHRDIKPGNILLSGEVEHEHVYLTDFGLTKRLGGSTGGITRSGKWVGTPEYSSPEQVRGLPVDFRTDVYSLGCVVYEMLTGERPYVRDDAIATMWAHATDSPPLPSKRRPELLPVFDSVVARATAKQPSERFATAGALAGALGDAIALQLLQGPQKSSLGRVASAVLEAAPQPEGPTEAAPAPVVSQRPRLTAPAAEPGAAPRMATTQPDPVRTAEPAELQNPPRHPVAVPTKPARSAEPPAAIHRRRPLVLIVGALAALAALFGVVLAIILAGGTTAHHAGHSSTAPSHAASGPTLAQNVSRLNDIVALFRTGKHLSQVEHQYAAAARNRQDVLQQLAAFHAPSQLRPAAETLRAMTADALEFNRDMAKGEFALARGPDKAHNKLRGPFIAEFNPYAQRFLGRTYTINEL